MLPSWYSIGQRVFFFFAGRCAPAGDHALEFWPESQLRTGGRVGGAFRIGWVAVALNRESLGMIGRAAAFAIFKVNTQRISTHRP